MGALTASVQVCSSLSALFTSFSSNVGSTGAREEGVSFLAKEYFFRPLSLDRVKILDCLLVYLFS